MRQARTGMDRLSRTVLDPRQRIIAALWRREIKLLPRVHPEFRVLYTITCKNSGCGKPIVLPLPIRRDNSPTQYLWPTDEKPRNFLCRECNHVYEYTFEDVQQSLGEGQALAEGLVDDTVFRIEARCGEENCGLP